MDYKERAPRPVDQYRAPSPRPISPDLSGLPLPSQRPPAFNDVIMAGASSAAQQSSSLVATPSTHLIDNAKLNASTAQLPLKIDTVATTSGPTQSDPTLGIEFKASFPVARIKRIMQADDDIGKVAQVTPHVVSRALELFMIKMIVAATLEGRIQFGGRLPKKVTPQHLKQAVSANDTFDFLQDIFKKVPDAPSKAKKDAASDSDEEAKKPKKRGKKRASSEA